MTLHEMLVQQSESWARLGHADLLTRFITRNGKAYTPAKRIGRKKKAGQCYMNAAHFVFSHENATYVEGYVIGKTLPIPIHHAWVTINGTDAMDPTLDAEKYEYFGVPIDIATLRKELIRNKVYGILDTGLGFNTTLMFKLDPELKSICENVKADPELKQLMEKHNG
jgi:hypothetical protein